MRKQIWLTESAIITKGVWQSIGTKTNFTKHKLNPIKERKMITAEETQCEQEDCVFTSAFASRTSVGWEPQYNKEGTLINSDPNKTVSKIVCITCNRSWNMTEGAGVHTVEEILE